MNIDQHRVLAFPAVATENVKKRMPHGNCKNKKTVAMQPKK